MGKIRREDLGGRQFGRLVVLPESRVVNGHTLWKCRCACGLGSEVRADSLKSGDVHSCGCIRFAENGVRRDGTPNHEVLTGRVFGRLTVLGLAPRLPTSRGLRWHCRCECGKEVISPGRNLKCGKATSCGCRQRETAARQAVAMGEGNIRHGMTDTPEYARWHGMMLRCYNPKDPGYKWWGGRGIKVCERWHTFENFHADMGARPSVKHSIDRIDPNGDYCPENCRWATQTQQQRNKRSNRLLTHNGETKCLAEWAETYGLTTLQLWQRLRSGWPLQDALETPVGERKVNNTQRESL
jgi:hypothetical protein